MSDGQRADVRLRFAAKLGGKSDKSLSAIYGLSMGSKVEVFHPRSSQEQSAADRI